MLGERGVSGAEGIERGMGMDKGGEGQRLHIVPVRGKLRFRTSIGTVRTP